MCVYGGGGGGGGGGRGGLDEGWDLTAVAFQELKKGYW